LRAQAGLRRRLALEVDRDRLVEVAVLWFAETCNYLKDGRELQWADLSDCERGLYRAIEKYTRRKAEKES
jgi:hypothetical protein